MCSDVKGGGIIWKVYLEKLNKNEIRKDSEIRVFGGKGNVDVVQRAWICVPT